MRCIVLSYLDYRVDAWIIQINCLKKDLLYKRGLAKLDIKKFYYNYQAMAAGFAPY